MDFSKMIKFPTWNSLPPEFISSVLAMIIIIIFALIIHFKLKKYDPLTKPSTFLTAVEEIVNYADRQVIELMGESFKGFGGYIVCVGAYIFLSFLIGMIGIPNFFQPEASWYLEALPNSFTNMAMPLSIALVTFCLTHFTAMKYKKLAYFKRYVEPVFLFLPVNLISMWSSLLSLTLRLFGNALAGYCIITIIYIGFGTIIPPLGNYAGLAITPFIAPFAHLFFDVFDGLIQLAVFCMLTMINISSEYISKENLELEKQEKMALRHEKIEKRKQKLALKKAK